MTVAADLPYGTRALAAASEGAWPRAAALLDEMSEQELERWVVVLARLTRQAQWQQAHRASGRGADHA